MRNKLYKILAAGFVLALAFTLSCSSDDGGGGGGNGSNDASTIIKKAKISGTAQKGPFVKATVKIYELNANLEKTKNSFNGKTDDNGYFEIEIKNGELASPYIIIEVSGKYIDEVSGKESTNPITLNTLTDVSAKDTVNVNVLTHLEYEKVLNLAKGGKDFEEAKKDAQKEVLNALGISESGIKSSEGLNIFGASTGDSLLLAVSILLQGNRQAEDISSLLAEIGSEINNNGTLSESVKAEVASGLADVDMGNVKKNILKQDSSAKVPNIEDIRDIVAKMDPDAPPVVKPSSSSAGSSSSLQETPSSSSAGSSSSLQETGQIDGNVFTDPRDGKKYKFEVASDGRVWMNENLNYSRDNTLGWCYGVDVDGANPHRDSTSCGSGYGRVYEYATAMDGNSLQGLCPNGWHVPSVAEWSSVLSSGGLNNMKMSVDFYIFSGNYNLSADYPPLGWKERGNTGFYWTSRGNSYLTVFINGSSCVSDCGVEAQTGASAVDKFSIRCIANEDLKLNCGGNTYDPSTQVCSNGTAYARCGNGSYNPSTQFCSGGTAYALCGGNTYNPSTQVCSSGTVYARCGDGSYNPSTQFCFGGTAYALCGGNTYRPALEECVGGTVTEKPKPTPTPFTDIRDSKGYNKITIGTQTWMAENLNYNASGSKCYDGDPANCTKYGKLYDWATAMALNSSCNSSSCSSQIDAKHRGICPSGWHIPSDADWNVLMKFIDCTDNIYCAGTDLKATSGWNAGNGTDNYGFSALPGGYGPSEDGFDNVGLYGDWWSTSEYSNNAYLMGVGYDYEYTSWFANDKYTLHSVRCLQD